MSKIDLVAGDWVDLVFEGKNQAYGAYKLRKGTTKRNIIAMFAVLAAAVVLFSFVAIKSVIEANQKAVAVTQANELSALDKVKKKAEVKQKPKVNVEPEKVVERVKSSVKFTAPVIKKDSEVKPEDELKTQEEIMTTKTAIGALDVKGNDDANGEVLKIKEVVAQPEPKPEVETKIFEVVEQMPTFPGGDAALMEFLRKNVVYPVVAQENGVQGRVVISFVVERDGSITDVKVARSVDPSLDREAARVVKSMPNWIPGKQNGSSVRVKYNVPVSFRLQ
ncbi:TonB family protein [Prevotella sp. oral taxon 475]|jgi:tonB family C-terminal domain|uniref:energy transducer TonB n=1 Tax=Prevotella sp. oral taxon 475 TaxID=712471 RepID=UPI001BAB77CB|nr:energy transducer TonB [Prevotella sp. oral taxon 475]QUB47732.1 TonB family protein [Prevotella sp. oral taxon 475]